jgi:hypothetical protein
MKYLCLAYGDMSRMEALPKAHYADLARECKPYDDELNKTKGLILHEGLTTDATALRPRGGKLSITDGPFIETKEQVGGFFVIEAVDLNDAIRIASRHPAAHLGEDLGWGIEIRTIEVFQP